MKVKVVGCARCSRPDITPTPFQDIVNGLRDRFPLCCIAWYAWAGLRGIEMQGARYGGIGNGERAWVPCPWHAAHPPTGYTVTGPEMGAAFCRQCQISHSAGAARFGRCLCCGGVLAQDSL